tara:strand:- start:110 stop:502 length:393 start_codon:yes stop_codon:yes gene_type:complete
MKNNISKKQLREFGFLIGFGFPIVIGWILPMLGGHLFRMWTLWIGIPGIALGLIKPNLLFYPYKAWIQLGYALGWINSRIILGLVFLIVLQPIALIMKITGYDPLRKNKSKKNSYRENKQNHSINLTRIF